MASRVSPLPRTSAPRSAPDTWPARPVERWLLRLALALPFVVVALVSQRSTWLPAANVELAARGDLVRWGDTDVSWMADTFPPLSAALSSLLGGRELWLNLLAAGVIGFTLQRLAGALVRRGLGGWASAAVVATLALTPPLYYLAANDLQALLGLALVVLALDQIASFVEQHATEAGFRAGLALGLAVMIDPGAWLYALTLAAVAPFFARRAGRTGRGANRATVAVLIFPAAAAVAFWLYASWWFSADPVGGLGQSAVAGWFPGGVGPSAGRAALLVAQGLMSVPLFVVALGFRAVRDRWSLIAPLIAVTGLFASLWLGVRSASGQTYVLLTALYVLLLAVRQPTRARRVVVGAAAVAQAVLIWVLVLAGDSELGQWLRAVAATW